MTKGSGSVVAAGVAGLFDQTTILLFLGVAVTGLIGLLTVLYTFFYFYPPSPRPARASEKQYITIGEDGHITARQPLPCWHDNHVSLKEKARKKQISTEQSYEISEAEVFMSLVVPAYNEEDRLLGMLEEAVEYLEAQYGPRGQQADTRRGWEILLVDDGSRDKTVAVALDFARTHVLRASPPAPPGPWNGAAGGRPTNIPPGAIRVVSLEQNRGKGGAVTHGMRHARGTYVVFADADGASRFRDLGKLVAGCERVADGQGRAVGVGSRAHMVGTEAVVQRSALRNALMRAFHLCIWLLTTPRVATIKDTQCGFKLFSRPALPYIVPYMHSEGWIFDVEMLMLAESAAIPMVEVPVGWKEVTGSKLNVIKDSIGMALGLALLRVAWGTGIYRRD